MKEFKPIKEGKVREIYDTGENLILVVTDRISAFDHILKNKVTDKGVILTGMSAFWFDFTKDIIKNHMVSTDTADMPEYFQNESFKGRSMLCKKLKMLPVECIVRGYITGSGWASYQKTGEICGIKLPEGLKESEKFEKPLYTPSTKAEIGDHDDQVPLAVTAPFGLPFLHDDARHQRHDDAEDGGDGGLPGGDVRDLLCAYLREIREEQLV